MKSVCVLFLALSIFACQKESSPTAAPLPPQPAGQDQQNEGCEKVQLSTNITENSNIIGGERVLATDADSKTTAMIIATEKNSGNTFVCTATPIAPRTLITAAHCLDRAAKVTAVFYTDLTCASGFKFARDTIRAVDFSHHPQYNPNIIQSDNPDIGLVHLASDIKPGYPIYKISVEPESLNSDLFLYGYGITGSNNTDSTYLRKVSIMRNEYVFEPNSIMIPDNGVRGICLGDSGGPGLVSSGGELQIASVNSFGYGPRNDVCGGKSSLILLHPFMSWIRNTVNNWGENVSVGTAVPSPEPVEPPVIPDPEF